MLEAQQVWQLRSELPSEVLKAIADVELHVQHDLEHDDIWIQDAAGKRRNDSSTLANNDLSRSPGCFASSVAINS